MGSSRQPWARGACPPCPTRRTLIAGAAAVLAAPALARAPAPAERVVTLYQGATDIAAALDVRPVGIVESWTQKPIYRYLRPRLAGTPILGLETQPNLEALVAARPDAIVASRFRHARIRALLSRIAPTVILDDTFDFLTGMRVIGPALGRGDLAHAHLAGWHARVAALRARLAALPGWPWRIAVVDFREDHVRAYLQSSYSGLILSALGFTRTPAQSDPGIMLRFHSFESIPLVDADVCFVLMRADTPAVKAQFEAWTTHPLWTRLRSARAGRVFPVDNITWSLSGGFLAADHVLRDVETHLLGKRVA